MRPTCCVPLMQPSTQTPRPRNCARWRPVRSAEPLWAASPTACATVSTRTISWAAPALVPRPPTPKVPSLLHTFYYNVFLVHNAYQAHALSISSISHDARFARVIRSIPSINCDVDGLLKRFVINSNQLEK